VHSSAACLRPTRRMRYVGFEEFDAL
jgi:hypothetical protein